MSNIDISMRDYNFFKASKGTKTGNKRKNIIYVLIILVYLVLITGFYFYTEFQAKLITENVNKNKEYLALTEIQSSLKHAQDIKSSIDYYKNYNLSIEGLSNELEALPVIGSTYINTVTSAVPVEVSFENMVMSNDNMQIQGVSDSRQAIADFINNLNELDIFEGTHITNITKEDSRYKFILDTTLRGVIVDEADQ